MRKFMKLTVIIAVILMFTACKKGYLGLSGVLLSPARNVTGYWSGTLTWCDNSADDLHTVTDPMTLDLTMSGNNITGVMTVASNEGTLTGTINGVKITFQAEFSGGCINVHGTFTSTNMDGANDPANPPYLSCGETLNDGWGSKGIVWHLQKQ